MRPLATLFAAALLLSPLAAAQTFTVTVETKTADHPYNGQGHPMGYVIDGEQGPTVTLVEGETYTFQMSGVSAIHPFYISTDAAGGGAGEYTDGVTGNGASGNATLTFTPTASAVGQELWYQCVNHAFMGFRIEVIGGLATEDDDAGRAFALAADNPTATAPRVSLQLAEAENVRIEAFDLRGRRVAVVHRGALSAGAPHVFTLRTLRSGAYVVRAVGEGWTETLKLSVAR